MRASAGALVRALGLRLLAWTAAGLTAGAAAGVAGARGRQGWPAWALPLATGLLGAAGGLGLGVADVLARLGRTAGLLLPAPLVRALRGAARRPALALRAAAWTCLAGAAALALLAAL